MANLILSICSLRRALPASCALSLALGAVTAAAQVAAPVLQPDMPITIDAESSEFDYENSSLVFRGLRLDQGNLQVRADLAQTAKLDFDDGTWVFTGNVQVEADATRLYCDKATLKFVDHQLASAELSGGPARFEQQVAETQAVNSGEANEIKYGMLAGTLELAGAARFSDGVNEISGELITYDLTAQRLTAGSGDSGPVKILIEPPARLEEGLELP